MSTRRALLADLEQGVWTRWRKSLAGRRVELEQDAIRPFRWVSMIYYGETGYYQIHIFNTWGEVLEECKLRYAEKLKLDMTEGGLAPDGELKFPDSVVNVYDAIKYLDTIDGSTVWEEDNEN